MKFVYLAERVMRTTEELRAIELVHGRCMCVCVQLVKVWSGLVRRAAIRHRLSGWCCSMTTARSQSSIACIASRVCGSPPSASSTTQDDVSPTTYDQAYVNSSVFILQPSRPLGYFSRISLSRIAQGPMPI